MTTRSRWSKVWPSTGNASMRSWPVMPKAGRLPGCPASIGLFCGLACSNCCGGPTSRTPSSSTKPSSWPSCCQRTSRPGSSTAFSPECYGTDPSSCPPRADAPNRANQVAPKRAAFRGVGLRLAVEDQRLRREDLPPDELLGQALLRGVIDDGQRPQILRTDRQDAVAIVAPPALDRGGEPGQRCDFLLLHRLQPLEVQHALGQPRGRRHGRLLVREEFTYRHAVELRQLSQSLN